MHSKIDEVIRTISEWNIPIIIPTSIIELKNLKDWNLLYKLSGLHLSIDSLVNNYWKDNNTKEVLQIVEKLREMRLSNLMVNTVLRKETWTQIPDLISYFVLNRGIPLRMTFESPCSTLTEDMKKRYNWLIDNYSNLALLVNSFSIPLVIDSGCSKFDACGFRKNKERIYDYKGDSYPCTNSFFSSYKFNESELKLVYEGKHAVCNTCRAVDGLWKKKNLRRPD